MNEHEFNALFRHDALPPELAAALHNEVECGLDRTARLQLAAAIEGLLTDAVPGYHRRTAIDPLAAARSLARMAIAGHRLWTDAEKPRCYAAIDRAMTVARLLDYWVRARSTYREREAGRAKIHYADGRPADLTTLTPKAA